MRRYSALFSVFHHGPEYAPPGTPTWVIGGCAGVTFYLSTLPIDRVKTIMMTQPLTRAASSTAGAANRAADAAPRYRSAAAAARDVLAREGIIGLYRGCAPTLVRTFCGQAVALSAYHFATTQLANPHTRP